MTVPVEDFLALLLAQLDDPYVYGAEASVRDPDPDAWDCSELVEWACHRLGVTMPDGSKNQLAFCDRSRSLAPVHQAIAHRGALLFRMTGSPTHVAVSLGDGRTVEARGRDYGVGVFSAHGRGWTHGALVPGLGYGPTRDETEVDPVELSEAYAALKGGLNHVAAEVERRTNLLDSDLEAIKRDLATVHRDVTRLLEIVAGRP